MSNQKLKGLIVANDGNQQNLADAMGISRTRLNAKIKGTGGAQFTQNEMLFIKNRYELSDEQFNDIFLS